MRAEVILGPPGTGKTHKLLELLQHELEAGVAPYRIAFVTFTRAARRVIQERVAARFGLREADVPWVRTIHSAAFRLIRPAPGILDETALAEFAARYGYELSDLPSADIDDAPQAPQRHTPDDRALSVYQWAQNCRLDFETALARWPYQGVQTTRARLLLERFAAFKRERGLLDFADLLEVVLQQGLRPPVEIAFVDEAQDLSPLQALTCQMWFQRCRRVYVAGDDDQAIYGFQGANAQWLREVSQGGDATVLEQSRRVPSAVHRLASRIISRNEVRVPKAYLPRPAEGAVEMWERDELAERIPAAGDAFVLARNRIHLSAVAAALAERGEPFLVEGRGAYSPLGDAKLRAAIRAGEALGDAGLASITAKEVAAFLGYVGSGGLLPAGTKKLVQQAADAGRVLAASDLVELGLGDLVDFVRRSGSVASMSKLKGPTRGYLLDMIRRHGRLPEPRIRLMSIHAAKGREADHVVLLPCMTRSTWDEYRHGRRESREAENRVFYVGATRAKETLALVRPWTRKAFDLPSVGGGAA